VHPWAGLADSVEHRGAALPTAVELDLVGLVCQSVVAAVDGIADAAAAAAVLLGTAAPRIEDPVLRGIETPDDRLAVGVR